MDNFKGVIIEESLADPSVLEEVKILSTKVEEVTEKHQTPWLQQWTLHTVEVKADKADYIAEKLSQVLDTSHDDWYADYKNEKIHYVIYTNKVFKINRKSKGEYQKATEYGISLGIPDYQVDFADNVTKWER